jgi:hypothetical protein
VASLFDQPLWRRSPQFRRIRHSITPCLQLSDLWDNPEYQLWTSWGYASFQARLVAGPVMSAFTDGPGLLVAMARDEGGKPNADPYRRPSGTGGCGGEPRGPWRRDAAPVGDRVRTGVAAQLRRAVAGRGLSGKRRASVSCWGCRRGDHSRRASLGLPAAGTDRTAGEPHLSLTRRLKLPDVRRRGPR